MHFVNGAKTPVRESKHSLKSSPIEVSESDVKNLPDQVDWNREGKVTSPGN